MVSEAILDLELEPATGPTIRGHLAQRHLFWTPRSGDSIPKPPKDIHRESTSGLGLVLDLPLESRIGGSSSGPSTWT